MNALKAYGYAEGTSEVNRKRERQREGERGA